jgi:hypothetical protein
MSVSEILHATSVITESSSSEKHGFSTGSLVWYEAPRSADESPANINISWHTRKACNVLHVQPLAISAPSWLTILLIMLKMSWAPTKIGS